MLHLSFLCGHLLICHKKKFASRHAPSSNLLKGNCPDFFHFVFSLCTETQSSQDSITPVVKIQTAKMCIRYPILENIA